jgi:hydrogenase/urease accessory protein HupE
MQHQNSPTIDRMHLHFLIWIISMAPSIAFGHLMEVGQGSINFVGEKVFLAMSIPSSAFSSSDDNGDGKLDSTEIKNHQQEIITSLKNSLHLLGDGKIAVWQHMVVSPAPIETKAAGTQPAQLMLVGAADWKVAPKLIEFDYGLWRSMGSQPPLNLGAPLETIKLRVTRTQDGQTLNEEMGLLSPLQARLEFFAPIQHHVLNFARHGFDHILSGADHIVFLIALLASGIGLRRWAALLTTFTLAHGLTFGLASMGWLSVSAALVEPAIAASIVCIALLHLVRAKISLYFELVLVLCLGLVHGLGFASAMQETGGSQLIAYSPYPLWSILGFNLGVELGQCVVALALGLWVWVFRKFVGRQKDFVWQQASGFGALIVGIYWLVERITA